METRKQAPLAALAVALMLALSPLGALAEKGGKHNNGKGNNGHKNGNDGGSSVSVEFRFGDGDRRAVQEYYQSPARGRPLPHDLVVYDLPPDLRYRLPPPPAGHRYVQLGADVLMIAIGTSMVVDAIEDMVR